MEHLITSFYRIDKTKPWYNSFATKQCKTTAATFSLKLNTSRYMGCLIAQPAPPLTSVSDYSILSHITLGLFFPEYLFP